MLDLICGCLGQVNLVVSYSEGFACDLNHLRVQPLAHFGAAVTQQNGAVLVNLKINKTLFLNFLSDNDLFVGCDNIVQIQKCESHVGNSLKLFSHLNLGLLVH